MTIRLTCPTCSRTFTAKRGALITCECGQKIRPRLPADPDGLQGTIASFARWLRLFVQ